MNCTKCSGPTRVLTNYRNKDMSTKRRRECTKCGHRFTTRERADENHQTVEDVVDYPDLFEEQLND